MQEEILFKETKSGTKLNDKGELISQYQRKVENLVDIKDVENNKIGIDANIMTSAILNKDFKEIIIQNMGKDFPYTTESCKKETIGNVRN
ncbi:MAG: hypothetical protein Q7S33_04905 [Nanoarchaeota archaeon]|nr:hypothetical protein [Nanoarchaeota archaeon]